MPMNKKIISFAILPVLGIVLVGGANIALGATRTDHPKPLDGIATAIATKFNLNSVEVQAVVDQAMAAQRTEMEAQQAKNFRERLATAVSEKKLTQAQADLIIAKQAELKTARESAKDQTPAQRLAAMKEQMASLKKWATDNKIPEGYMMFGSRPMGPGMDKGHNGHHGPRGFEMNKRVSPETTK